MRKQKEMSWDLGFSFIGGGFPFVTGPLERDFTVSLICRIQLTAGPLVERVFRTYFYRVL